MQGTESVLSDGLVTLRPFTPGDVDGLLEAARESIIEVYPWAPWCHPGYARPDAEAWITSTEKMWGSGLRPFVIADSTTGRLLGGCGLNQIESAHRRGNIGYWVRTTATGRGVATAAVKLLARYGFDQMKLIRIEILMAVENAASRRVAEKVGARLEGTLRDRLVYHGNVHDAYLFSLVPKDLVSQGIEPGEYLQNDTRDA